MWRTHASELQFLFDPNAFFPNVDYPVPSDPFPLSRDERRLSREMVQYWTNFVATLDPNHSRTGSKPDLVAWGGERDEDFWRRYDSTSDDVQALATPLPHTRTSILGRSTSATSGSNLASKAAFKIWVEEKRRDAHVAGSAPGAVVPYVSRRFRLVLRGEPKA